MTGFFNWRRTRNNTETIKEIFRAAHTLKGSSATMGFTPIADLTHAMESLLDLLRSGTLTLDSALTDLLLEGTDTLRVLVGQVGRGEPMEADTQDLVNNLKLASKTVTPERPSAPVNETPPQSITDDITPGAIAFKLKIVDNCLMPAVRGFMIYNVLSGLGSVASANPAHDKLDDLQAGQTIDITFAASGDPGEVIDAMSRISEVELISYTQASDSVSTEPRADAVPSAVEPVRKPDNSTETAPKPIQTVRVGVDRLDTLMNLVAELVIDRTRISRIESELLLKDHNDELIQSLGETAMHVGRVVTELQEHIMKVRLLPVEQVFNRFPRMVRDLAHKAGKEIDFVLEGQETELDRSILEDIVDPLTHLLRNAVDHGIETPEERMAAGKPRRARIVLAAKQEENRIIIEVEEDGRGISLDKVKAAALKKGIAGEDALSRMSDEDALQLIFASGLSTAEKVTDVSGRGVGMDVVRNNIQNLSGNVEVHTVFGHGTRFRINLPLTLAIIQALITSVGENVFAIPLSAVAETFQCDAGEVQSIDRQPAINFRGSVLHLMRLGAVFGIPQTANQTDARKLTFVVVRTGSLKVGLVVDKLVGEQEVVIKSLGSFFGDVKGIAGATILGDGRVALIVDAASLGGIVNRRKLPRSSMEAVRG